MKKLFTTLILLLAWQLRSYAQPISVSATPITSTAVGQYEKFEIGISLSLTTFTNQFDPNEIDVYVKFTHVGSGQETRVNAFWYQDFERNENTPDPTSSNPCDVNAVNVSDPAYLTPKATPLPWRARFAPPLTGEWQYQVFVKHVSSATVYVSAINGFSVFRSGNKGYVKLGPNRRNFIYGDDKTSFIPLGANMTDKGSVIYNRALYKQVKGNIKKLAENKGNTVRLFMTPEGFGIEWRESGIGKYLARQNRAFDLDEIFRLAEQSGVKIQLTLESSHSFNENPDGAQANYIYWNDNPYRNFVSTSLRHDFFREQNSLNYFKRRLRYIVARWGYSPALLSYEFFNEVDRIDTDPGQTFWDTQSPNIFPNYSLIIIWHAIMSDYVKSLDKNHMLTSSVAHHIAGDAGAASGTALAALPVFDYFQSHSYTNDMNMPYQLKAYAERTIKKNDKAFLCGEFGPDYSLCWTGAESFTDYSPNYTFSPGQHAHANNELHNSVWSGLFNGSAGPPLYWFAWDIFNDCWGGAYESFKPVSAFLEGDNFFTQPLTYYCNKPSGDKGPKDDPTHNNGNNSVPEFGGGSNPFDGYLSYGINTSDDAALDVFAAQSNDSKIYGWIHNRNNYWFNLPHFPGPTDFCKDDRTISPSNVPTLTKQTMTFHNVGCDGMYKVDFYSTYPQFDINGDAIRDNGGIIQPFTQLWQGAYCGNLTITLPTLPPLVPNGGPYAPDYAFKITRMQDYWSHSLVIGGLNQLSKLGNYNSDQVFYSDNNGAIRKVILNTASNTFQHELISPSTPNVNEQAHGPICVNDNQQIYYKGGDSRLQVYYYDLATNVWTHIWLTDWSSSSQNVGNYIASGPYNIFYQGIDNRIHRYFFNISLPGWQHSILPDFGDPNTNITGPLAVNDIGTQVYYRGADNRLQCYYMTNNGTWEHRWLSLLNWPEQNVAGDIKCVPEGIFYAGADGKLHKCYFDFTLNDWVNSWIFDASNQHIPIGSNTEISLVGNADQIFFTGVDGQIRHLYGKQGNKYFTDLVICGDDLQNSYRGNGNIISDNQEAIYYIGLDNLLHLYAFDNGCTPRSGKRSKTAHDGGGLTTGQMSGATTPNETLLMTKGTTGVYPNPFTDRLTVKCDIEQFDEIRITDMVGRTYYQSGFSVPVKEQVVNAASFPAGMYMVLILNKGKTVHQSRVVKL